MSTDEPRPAGTAEGATTSQDPESPQATPQSEETTAPQTQTDDFTSERRDATAADSSGDANSDSAQSDVSAAERATPESDAATAPEPQADTETLEHRNAPSSDNGDQSQKGAQQDQPSAPRASVTTADDEHLFEAAMASMTEREEQGDSSMAVRKGERIEAEVIEVRHDRIFVNLGTKAEGELPLDEFSSTNHPSAVGLAEPGQRFEVVVIKPGGGERPAIVSKRKADFDQKWREIVEAFESGTIFNATVVDKVKGGLEVDIGVRGFIPTSHVGLRRHQNLDKYIGESIPVKIIELERDRKKVVLSNRVATEHEREASKKEVFDSIKPQDVVDGVVRRLTTFGAFVDIGGVDGLLHVSEMSWMRIDHPKEAVKEGQQLKVMVLRLDKDKGRISLGLRQVLPDPWKEIGKNYKPGQKINVVINRLVQSGAFVRLPEGAEAFLPAGEIAEEPIKQPSDRLEVGQECEATIIDLRPDERRMVLSLRDGAMPRRCGGYAGDEGARFRKRVRRRRPDQTDGEGTGGQRGGSAPSGATIGERLGLLRGILKNQPEAEPEPEPPKKTAAKESAKPKASKPKNAKGSEEKSDGESGEPAKE